MVIVSVEDIVCSRCTNLINYLDRLENDVERVRTNIINLLHKKYGLNDDSGVGVTQSATLSGGSPPPKMQKLSSNVAAVNRISNNSNDEGDRVRKSAVVQQDGSLGKPPVSAVQQIKISTPQTSQTQTLQRKTTKIYKCLTCDYKTSDMRLFNTHYETCKQQNFQCKNCKKIFPNFGAMKQHMIKDHNTPMDNTCAVCHINFVSDQALRKHMEINHSTNVVVTSSTTIPAAPAAEAITPHQPTTTSTPLFTCNHCQFKSTDKPVFDEHMRKHLPGAKPKPFKCRLCSQRFETREQATVHAKQHQPNYFKCGTCSMSFPKRELLVKHFEVHQQQRQQSSPQPPQNKQNAPIQQQIVTHTQAAATTTSNTLLTTQKLLQETIDEALSDTVPTTAPDANTGGGANANIRFFSCHICSLTFIQENYYNQHMETHKREKKAGAATTASTSSTLTNSSALATLSSSSGILSEGIASAATKSDNHLGITTSTSSGIQHSSSSASGTTISEADIESIFEKMHSDKGDGSTESTPSTSGTNATGDNLVITSQAGSGGITFNITIPQSDGGSSVEEQGGISTTSVTTPTTTAPVSASMDMPMLDQPDDTPANASRRGSSDKKTNRTDNSSNDISALAKQSSGPVSMPSLDDDGETQGGSQPAQIREKDKDSIIDGGDKVTSNAAKSSVNQEMHDDDDSTQNTHTDTNINEEQSSTGVSNSGIADESTGENMETSGDQQHVTMELDEAMQAQVEGGQIKFILNENGQLLQLDNHIITDAEGNQILVQDPEQIQQLLQSVGVLQGGEGLDGETLQMMTDANGQMVLVQGDNNETQLIDASLLNADGQLVIQQGQDGELGEGAHVIGEDGTRIPVSVSYTADGQPIVQVQQQVLETAEGQQLLSLDKDGTQGTATSESSQGGTSSGGGFFALEDLMQQSADAANAKDSE